MKVPENWDDLVAKCKRQDEYLKRRFYQGRSFYDIISENLDGYAGEPQFATEVIEPEG